MDFSVWTNALGRYYRQSYGEELTTGKFVMCVFLISKKPYLRRKLGWHRMCAILIQRIQIIKKEKKKKKSTKDIKGMASWALNQKIAFYVQRKCWIHGPSITSLLSSHDCWSHYFFGCFWGVLVNATGGVRHLLTFESVIWEE